MKECNCLTCARAEITDHSKSCKIHFCTKRCEGCKLSTDKCHFFAKPAKKVPGKGTGHSPKGGSK